MAVQCQVTLQAQKGGDADIGRKLFPIMERAGMMDIVVSPRQVYVDDSLPHMVEGFTRNTFTAMIKGVAEEAISQGLISQGDMDKGIKDLY